jgi:hypothetical protein
MLITAYMVLVSKPHKVEPFLYDEYTIIQYRLLNFFIDSDIKKKRFSPLIRSQEDCLTK